MHEWSARPSFFVSRLWTQHYTHALFFFPPTVDKEKKPPFALLSLAPFPKCPPLAASCYVLRLTSPSPGRVFFSLFPPLLLLPPENCRIRCSFQRTDQGAISSFSSSSAPPPQHPLTIRWSLLALTIFRHSTLPVFASFPPYPLPPFSHTFLIVVSSHPPPHPPRLSHPSLLSLLQGCAIEEGLLHVLGRPIFVPGARKGAIDETGGGGG
jgi:hypothetical protein